MRRFLVLILVIIPLMSFSQRKWGTNGGWGIESKFKRDSALAPVVPVVLIIDSTATTLTYVLSFVETADSFLVEKYETGSYEFFRYMTNDTGTVTDLDYNTLVKLRVKAYKDGIVSDYSNPDSARTLTYAQDVLNMFTTNVVAFWPLNETTGTVADDISANDNKGDYLGSAGTYSLNYDSIFNSPVPKFENGYVNVYSTGFRDDLNPDEGFISFWLKANRLTVWDTLNYMYLYSFSPTSSNDNKLVAFTSNVKNIAFSYNAGGKIKPITIGVPYTTKWINFGFAFSKTKDSTFLYVNGIKQKNVATDLGTWEGTIDSIYTNLLTSRTTLATFRFRCRMANFYILNQNPNPASIKQSIVQRGVILNEGDSRTAGSTWSLSAAAQASESLQSEYALGRRGFYNASVTGAKTLDIINRASEINSKKIEPGNNIIILFAGINDYSTSAGYIYNNLKNYCINAKAAGWDRVILCTEIHSTLAGWDTLYLQLNDSIRANYTEFCDTIADLGAVTELQDATNTTYFSDGVHMTTAGYVLLRNCVAGALEGILKKEEE